MIYDASTLALPYEAPFGFSSSGASHCKGCGGRNFWRQSSALTPRDEDQAYDVERLSDLAPPRFGQTLDEGRRPSIKDGLRPDASGLACFAHRGGAQAGTRQVAEV